MSLDEGSARDHGEGESNKKKRVFQSKLPWYELEVEAQHKEINENQRKTRQILGVFQKNRL
jgi:hypothetical protein